MAILITQDRQVANLTPPEGKSRITVSVKSKVGSGLSVEIPFRESNEELDLPPLPQRKTD